MDRRTTVPWLVVSIIALAAIIVAIVIVGVAKLNTVTESSSTLGSSYASTSASASASATASATASTSLSGNTTAMAITAWNVTVNVPQELGNISYTLSDNVASFSAAAEDSLPSACSALKGGWEISRSSNTATSDSSAIVIGSYAYTLVTPSGTCSSDPSELASLNQMYQAMFQSLTAA